MGQATSTRSAVGSWVADLPAPAVDGREPWPVLSVSPEARSLLAHGQSLGMALDALPKGKDAALQRPPRPVPAGAMPAPPPQPAPVATPQRAPVTARQMQAARAHAGPPAYPPRVLRQATPPMYGMPVQPGMPIRGRMPEAAKKSLGAWAFLALVLGAASFAPFFWEGAPLQWIPATGLAALVCSFMVFSQARRGVTPRGTISAARWGCGFALITTTLWIIGILVVTGTLNGG